jgi:hypothetical protein
MAVDGGGRQSEKTYQIFEPRADGSFGLPWISFARFADQDQNPLPACRNDLPLAVTILFGELRIVVSNLQNDY